MPSKCASKAPNKTFYIGVRRAKSASEIICESVSASDETTAKDFVRKHHSIGRGMIVEFCIPCDAPLSDARGRVHLVVAKRKGLPGYIHEFVTGRPGKSAEKSLARFFKKLAETVGVSSSEVAAGLEFCSCAAY